MFRKLILIVSVINIFLLSSKCFGMHPSLQSVTIPGWGQSTLNNKKHARTFAIIEFTLWTTYLGSYTFSKHQQNQYQSFAVEHAFVNPQYKDHNYWVDIGNYIDINHHNEEHLRWRSFDEIYDDKDKWYWDSQKNMKTFESMRIKSDILQKNCEYILGAITLNHIISAIDSLYLIRSKNRSKLTVLPILSIHQNGLQFLIWL